MYARFISALESPGTIGFMFARGTALRSTALLLAGMLAVHDLRFVLAYGADAPRMLAEPGHEYLPFAAAAALVLIASAGIQLARRRGRLAPAPRRSSTLVAGTLRAAALLTALYVVQETFEGLLTPNHPVFEHGGWTVLPVALVAGAVITLLERGARRIEVRGEPGARFAAPAPVRKSRPAPVVTVPRPAVMGLNRAGRAPPR
jgi:hypothetical protein